MPAKGKMLVQMLTSIAGVSYSYGPREIVVLPAKEAEAHIAAGHARTIENLLQEIEEKAEAAGVKLRMDL